MIAGPPRKPVQVPLAVRKIAGGIPRPVWENELGGLTFAVGADSPSRYIKWAPVGSGIDLAAEAERLRWAAAHSPVPEVLGEGNDAAGAWLILSPIPGENAVSDRWKADPETAVRAIGRGLRALHDALPVAECPFGWQAADRLADARRRAAAGLIDPARWHRQHQHLDIAQALELLAEIPPLDRLVVCHGDACAPNTLLDSKGEWCGHVDLGDLGLADRWADLAVATWSTTWNYGQGWEEALLAAYGTAPDEIRTTYYRLLWDLGP